MDSMLFWAIVIAIITSIIRSRSFNREQTYYFKKQLVQMFQDTHAGLYVTTRWNIYISSEMRKLLCYPLTQEEIAKINSRKYEPEINYFNYDIVEFEQKKGTARGVIDITVVYQNVVDRVDIRYEHKKVAICCQAQMGHGWCVSSVSPL